MSGAGGGAERIRASRHSWDTHLGHPRKPRLRSRRGTSTKGGRSGAGSVFAKPACVAESLVSASSPSLSPSFCPSIRLHQAALILGETNELGKQNDRNYKERTKNREWKGGRKSVCLRQSKHCRPLSWRPESSSAAGGGGPATPHPKCWSSWGGSSSDAGRSVTPGPTPDAKVPASSFCPNAMVHRVSWALGAGCGQGKAWEHTRMGGGGSNGLKLYHQELTRAVCLLLSPCTSPSLGGSWQDKIPPFKIRARHCSRHRGIE